MPNEQLQPDEKTIRFEPEGPARTRVKFEPRCLTRHGQGGAE